MVDMKTYDSLQAELQAATEERDAAKETLVAATDIYDALNEKVGRLTRVTDALAEIPEVATALDTRAAKVNGSLPG